MPHPDHDKRTVFIRNIAYDIDQEAVQRAFEQQVGGVKRVHLLPAPEGEGRHKGCGFIEFTHPNFALAALHDDGAIVLGGRRISIQPARPKKNPSTPEKESVQSR
jgi:RNA recognition motif-containing protein